MAAPTSSLTPLQRLKRFQSWISTVGPYLEGLATLAAIAAVVLSGFADIGRRAAGEARKLSPSNPPTAADAPASDTSEAA